MNRRIKALETLRRIEETTLEELARDLGAKQAAQAAAVARADLLQSRAETEGQVTAPEALPYVGRFLANLRKEQSIELKRAASYQPQIEVLRAQVMDHFVSERRYDRLAETQRSAIVQEAERKAEGALEDLTISRFGR